jgi:crotonobetainyl-CoA:carnitine CoA-transferase CaiB-like acyl-CoA transferase
LSNDEGLLSGVRVLSFGAFVAGTTAPRLLADLGADVAKVESQTRPEVIRYPVHAIGDAFTEPSGAPTTVMYAAMTRGLRNLSIDMETAEGRALFHRLVRVSDVVIENFGGAVLDRWGCSYLDLLRDKPNLVMLSLSGYGRTGPRANYLAYASTIASYLGLASAWGYAHGTFSDYITAATGAVATVAAVAEARRTGTPVYLDVAQIDALPPLFTSIYAAPLNSSKDEPYVQNRVAGSWLSGIFAAGGCDQWLAVDIEGADDWKLLCHFLDCPELIVDELEKAETIRSNLEEALGTWAARWSAYTAMHHLQAAGLAAAAVQSPEDIFRDIQLRVRGFVERVNQADIGYVSYPGSPQRWSKTPGRAPVAPARLGEHTRDILSRWLTVGEDEFDALEACGAIFSADDPLKQP